MELENDGMLGLKGLEMSATCEEGAKACTSADTLCSGQSGWSLLLCLAPIMLYRFLCEGGEGETIFQQTRKDLDAGMSISQVAEKFSFFTEGLTLADDDKAFLGVVARDLPRRVDEWACESGLFELQASNTSTLSDEGDLLNESEACARVSLSQDDAPIDRDAEEPYGEAGQLQPADAARFLFDYVDSLPSVGVSEYDQVCRCCLANCGKTGGLFSTPEGLASLISSVVASQVACEEVTLYDPCCGVGFALEACFHALSNEHTVSLFGQDADCEAYEICRLRTYFMPKSQSSWNLLEGDVLLEPRHSDCGAFDVVIACPPTLVSWPGDSEPLLLEDERFAPAGCLAPRESSDLAFAMHAYHCLARDGIGVLVLFPAPLRRGAQEEGIRRHLVESNAIEAVIQLPPNLFIDSSSS